MMKISEFFFTHSHSSIVQIHTIEFIFKLFFCISLSLPAQMEFFLQFLPKYALVFYKLRKGWERSAMFYITIMDLLERVKHSKVGSRIRYSLFCLHLWYQKTLSRRGAWTLFCSILTHFYLLLLYFLLWQPR